MYTTVFALKTGISTNNNKNKIKQTPIELEMDMSNLKRQRICLNINGLISFQYLTTGPYDSSLQGETVCLYGVWESIQVYDGIALAYQISRWQTLQVQQVIQLFDQQTQISHS